MKGGSVGSRAGIGLLASGLLLLCPGAASAVDGFDRLKFGMGPDEVRATYPDQVVHDAHPENAPEGAIGGRLVLTGDPRIFDSPVEVSCFFSASGLSTVRLQYKAPAEGNAERLVDWYRPHWGEPLKSVERQGSRRKVTWVWPWEGVEFRDVSDDGKPAYQRVDFSWDLKTGWTRTEAIVCKLLPASSGCPFADSFCAQQDSAMPAGQRTQAVEIADRRAEVSCTYEGFALRELRLQLGEPSDEALDWLEAILHRRLGPGQEERHEDSARIRIDTAWPDHKVELRVVRLARVKAAQGWTGPVEFLRMKRTP